MGKSEMEKIFLIGCTHFGHANIIKLANRPFDTVEEMDETLIRNWNETVSPTDHVYHLGDFAFRDHLKYLGKLNGHIFRLNGNHDPMGWSDYDYMEDYERPGVCLFHYPMEEWNGWYSGKVHFHAHTHKKDFISGVRRGNVCVEAIGYKPILMTDAIAMLLKENGNA